MSMSNTAINIIGVGHVIPSPPPSLETVFDVRPILKDKKSYKFLSKHDALALLAAHQAWESAGITIKDSTYHERTGLYFCVGIVPFEDGSLDKLAELSQEDGVFTYDNFSQIATPAMNPLLTFKCLPNMPLFHVSHHLQIKGNYLVSYPGLYEWFNVLQRAIFDLNSGIVDYAVVGAVADQRNFLVQNHIRRLDPTLSERCVDSASVLVLTKKEIEGTLATLDLQETHYSPFDPFQSPQEFIQTACVFPFYAGVVEPSLWATMKITEGERGNHLYSWKGNQLGVTIL